MDIAYIDWMYVADKLIYLFGYMVIIYLSYNLTVYHIEYSRIHKVNAASLIEKFWQYFFCFLIVAILAFAFTIKTRHKPERYMIAFIALLIPSFMGLAKGYELDKRLSRAERLQRKELLGQKNDNREQI